MKNRTKGTYQIRYEANGFVQEKTLISKSDFSNILQPIQKIISLLEDENRGQETQESKQLKNLLSGMFGNYRNCFPEGSPLHEAIKSGYILLPHYQGGSHKVSISKTL